MSSEKKSASQNDTSNKDNVNLSGVKENFKITVIDIHKKAKAFMEIIKNLKERISCNISNILNSIHIPKIEVCAIREHSYTKTFFKYGCLIGITACVSFGIVKLNPRLAFVVSMNNRPVAVVHNKLEFNTVLYSMQQTWKNNYGLDIRLNDIPTYKIKLLPSSFISNRLQIAKAIEANTNSLTKAYGISVNGEFKAILKDKQSADDILNAIKSKFSNEKVVGFFEDVKVLEAYVPNDYIQSFEAASAVLNNNIEGVKSYTVKKGDTLWDIADDSKITVEKLFELNPNLSDNLKIGQTIRLSAPKAIINVKTVEYAEINEKTPYETKFQNDQNKFRGDKKVLVSGETGEKLLKVAIIKQNGVEVSKEILEEKLLKEPKSELVAIGTKDYKKAEPKGTFRVPAFGSVTSRYGYRWGRMHEGVDISGKIGEPVYASDSGKVVFSGIESGYGNLVKIDHGGGMTTYYGHNSKNLVKVGQKVEKGDKIALVGNTGRSTGPHVHFEVRKNGRPQDPLKYIK